MTQTTKPARKSLTIQGAVLVIASIVAEHMLDNPETAQSVYAAFGPIVGQVLGTLMVIVGRFKSKTTIKGLV